MGQHEDKFVNFENRHIESLLKVLFPNVQIPVSNGNPKINEPDGIINLNGEEIGIEVRRFSQDDTLHREKMIEKMGKYLNEGLSHIKQTVIVQIDGNKTPIDKRSSEPFMQKVIKELSTLIPTLNNDCKIEVENVSISILQSYNKTITVNFLTSHTSQPFSYVNAVMKAFEEKNGNNYSIKTKWLLLCDNTSVLYTNEDLKEITNSIQSKQNQFEKIYILNLWKSAGIINPVAYQIAPIFKPLY
jgi:hypothetical protein